MAKGYKDTTKANKYFQAREDAGLSRYGAAESICVSPDTLIKYETSALEVPRETMLLMADVYRAPWLQDYYCAHVCPVHRGEFNNEQHGITDLAVLWYNCSSDAPEIADTLLKVAGDKRITDNEKPLMQKRRPAVEALQRACEEYLRMCEDNGI